MYEPGLLDHLLFLLLGVVYPLQALFLSRPMIRSVERWDTETKLSFYRSNSLTLLGLTALVAGGWLLAGRSPAWIGLRWPEAGHTVEVLGASLLLLGALAYEGWRDYREPEARRRSRAHITAYLPFLPATPRELRAFHGVSLSAAIGEEVLFRGFLMTYLMAVAGPGTAGLWLALIFPALSFAVAHYYQGWVSVGKIAVLSLTLGILYLVSRSLLYPMLLHLIVDVVGGYMGYRLLRGDN